MNRPIKFRAWDESIKTMHADIKHHFGFAGETLEKAAEEGLNDLVAITQKAYVLMQFTGLTDKNGKEIYEGDVVWRSWLKAADDIKDVVEWNDGGFHLGKTTQCIGYMERSDLEVIGNIYENPNLLSV